MTRCQFDALFIAIFPLALTIGIITIPVVSDYSNHKLAVEAASHTLRWFWGHTISGAAFGFSILAASFIKRYLTMKGQARSGMVSLLLIALGGALYAFGLGADGIGPLATSAGGGMALSFFEGSGIWVSGIFIVASASFGIGLITQVVGLHHVGLLKGVLYVIVLTAAIIFLGVGAIPSGWGLYGVAVAALIIYISISNAIWHKSMPE